MPLIPPSSVFFTVSISPAAPLLQQTVSVKCDVTPWPNGAYVHWILNDREFGPSSGVISNEDTSGRIVREKATEQLAGKWTCVVGHQGKMVQASAVLSLRGEMPTELRYITENPAVAH